MAALGLFEDLEHAVKAIQDGLVLVDGAPAKSPATLVGKDNNIRLVRPLPFVSRSGVKLQGALEDLSVGVTGKRCLDAGAGAGGFTDCLLQNGAAEVVAVDVGYGQFDWRLRNDARVELFERTNIKSFTTRQAGGLFDLVVADLSFIGLRRVTPHLGGLVAEGGSLLFMVKPQFEAPRSAVGPGGIVKDPAVWRQAMTSVADALEKLGIGVAGAAPARIKGAEGNQEFFLLARKSAGASRKAVEEAVRAASSSPPVAPTDP